MDDYDFRTKVYEYLQEHLRLEIDTRSDWESEGKTVTITVKLEGATVTSDHLYL
jgi:hypothetical protein